MKWMQERDLLIAQTMAFVQSVTGKAPEAVNAPEAARTPDAGGAVAASAAPRPSDAFESARPVAAALPEIALALPQAPTPTPKAPAVMPAPPAEVQPFAVKARIIEATAEAPREISSPAPFPRLDLREDFQSEIRARVASFRAHQERFSREREAYCAATMAKVHAVLKEGDLPPLPQSGK